MNESVVAALRRAVGGEHVRTGDAARPYAIDGRVPGAVVFPATQAEVAAVVKEAAAAGLSLFPRGGGTQLHLGNVPRKVDIVVCLERLNGVVAHEPADMTVTVEAGLPLARLQEFLGASRQYLPIDPPLPAAATVGGILATRALGPMRFAHRTIADWLLGIKVVTAQGALTKAGGRVVKNVAGYELGRLYTGSMGTLAVIVEATFKVQPLPRARGCLLVPCPDLAAARTLVSAVLGCPVQPVFIELVGGNEGGDAAHRALFELAGARAGGAAVLAVGFTGTPEEVEWQLATLEETFARTREGGSAGRTGAPVRAPWEAVHPCLLAAHEHGAVPEERIVCRVHVLGTELFDFLARALDGSDGPGRVRFAAHAGSGIARIHITGVTDAGAARERILRWRERAKAAHGRLIVETAPAALKASLDVWGEPGPDYFLHRAVKERMDPRAVLSPGRFIGGI